MHLCHSVSIIISQGIEKHSMTHITLPEEKTRQLPFYLAMEEYVAREMDLDDSFFIWQVKPTVIFGRNQLMESEVNIDYCRTYGIETYRRKSGGGCVYADMGNLMLSYVTKDDHVNLTFNRYINLVVLALYKMGIEAKATGRNDILIDGLKVSGSACYHIPGKSIVHGTLLYDTNMEHMVGSITPDNEKLRSKGVESVRQHITLLKDHTRLSLEEVKSFLLKHICDKEVCLDTRAVDRIEEMSQIYFTDHFIHGRNPRYSVTRKGRIEGVGTLEVCLELKNDTIKDLDITGDFFLTGDLEGGIIAPLRGKALTTEVLEQALKEDLGDIIPHLHRHQLIHILLSE